MAAPLSSAATPAEEGPWATPRSQALPTARAVMARIYGADGKPKPYAENKGRYLWTDAHGVCNYVAMARESGDASFLDRADALIADVHATLGADRRGKPLGRPDAPLAGGLRIGKVQDEGHPDGDGQYMHYLTKWMVALNRMALARGEARYNELAIQLAKAVHRHFVWSTPGGGLHMHWKMSIDLRRPAVMSEGNLDPFDCLATYKLLQEHAVHTPHALVNEIRDVESMVMRKTPGFSSGDPLDLGEALQARTGCDTLLLSCVLTRPALQVASWHPEDPWSRVLTDRSLRALEVLWQRGAFEESDHQRLAFRELGTAIGAQVNPAARAPWRDRVRALLQHWGDPGRLYARDSDITPVMYITALLPGAFSRAYDSLPPMKRCEEE